MTAPGDSTLIFTLLALFVGCCAYAAGRLHQRYETKREREEAYRDGYETASKRVFSLAARTLVPKRAVRASAAVRAAAGDEAPTVPVAEPVKAEPAPAEPTASPAVTPPATSPPVTPPLPTAPAPGFPAPPPPPRHAVAEPAAVGGVTYQPFPDPRPSVTEDADADVDKSPTADEQRPGKHFVPDELVHAATYRLPADRIFRARVHNGTPLPEEPTTPLAVPKPRRS